MSRPPYVGSGRLQEGGALATRKQDFNAHVSGTDFRQMASTVDITAIEGIVGTNVQEALESITAFVTSAGSGFISIGLADGYAQGTYTVGSEGYTTLRDAFNGAVADPRLQNGGVILLLAGTYTTSLTITIPAGITVVGEMAGSIIIGEMVNEPMFQIEGTANRVTIGGDDGFGDLPMDTGSKLEGVKFINLMLSDNLDGYAVAGAPSMTSVPMIRCSINSHFTCEQVRFIGRLAQGAPPRVSTYGAIGYSAGSSSGTHLNLYKCFFDGIMVPVRFTPGGGDVDSLTVESCRARVIGLDDDASDGAQELNCFVNLTACQAIISNNHVCPGPHTYIEYVVNVSTSYGDKSKLIVSGTRGYGAEGEDTYGGIAGINSGVEISVMQHGNNWGNKTGEWYVVAGLDYLGAGAIDAIVTNEAYGSAIVYVYGGSQIMTSNGNSSLRLVGIGKPRISLDNITATDSFTGNKKVIIESAKNIYFVCETALTSFYHTILANKDAGGNLAIDNCTFKNCALVVNEQIVEEIVIGGTPNYLRLIEITNCQFFQDGDYAVNISMVLPAAIVTLVDNCYFYLGGGGYVGGIGDSSSYESVMTDCTVTVSNCIMSLGDEYIDVASPLVGTRDHFFWISESSSRINLVNCKIMASEIYGSTARVDAALLTAGTFTKFIYLNGRNVLVDNCRISSIDSTYTSAAVDYQVAALYIEPTESATINNTIVGYGMCQVGGTTAFTASSGTGTAASVLRNSGLTVTNSSFLCSPTGNQFTAFSVDADLSSIPTYVRPRIAISGCLFEGEGSDGLWPVQHTAYVGGQHVCQGVLQIYAGMFDVSVSDCVIRGFAYTPMETEQLEFSGLFINNVNGDTLSNQLVSSVNVSNNKIYMQTIIADTVGMDDEGVSAVNIKSPIVNINNNYITLYFSGAETSDSYLECLRINCDDTVGYGDGMVANNIFSYRSDTNVVGMLKDYFVKINASSARGSFINNSFSDEEVFTSTGTSTTNLINLPERWYVAGNRNYRKTVTVNKAVGRISLIDTSSTPNLTGGQLLFGRETTMTSKVYAFGDTVTISYVDTTDLLEFDWIIPAAGIIPEGAKIISATVTRDISTTTPSVKTIQFTASSTTGGSDSSSSSNMTATGPVAKTWAATVDHYNIPGEDVKLILSINLTSTVDVTVDLTDFEITYII